ncbi:MAG: sialidase, partial [Gemmatimonadetes bacterium]|nr:sialidase [Gemmatimonadota bacterium]
MYRQLRYRTIGPVGNRVSAVAGVAGDASTYYAGAASGGIWKTTDGGVHWAPVFDDQPAQSIGALAVAATDPNVVWAGTGEACIRSNISIGNGVYKSTDAGKTWQHMGLENTGRISKVVIHPTNPDIVYVAALGHAYGPQQERGIYRTLDGGKSWERVLFVDENTGAADLVMDPNNPRILFAGMWQLEIHTWGRESGGPGSGIFLSRDGGATWKRLQGKGLPERPVGRIALDVARTNSNRVYALIETGDGVPWHGQETDRGELWRSEDGGETWRVVSYDRQLGGRQHYYTHMAVSPDNENEAYFLSAAFSKSLDGGATTVDIPFGGSPGGDNHDIWIDPTNASRMIVGNDGNVSISVTRGRSWQRVQLPIAQMYHVTVDNQIPYYVYGNRQDGPSTRGPSNSKLGGFGGLAGVIPRGDWHSVAGGESGWATPDPVDPNIVWSSASGSGSVGGIVVRYDERTRQAHNVEVWPASTVGWPAADVKYRFVWTFPLTISPHDRNKLYVGSQHVHVTTDGGRSWQVISPDLTLNDRSRMGISGGLTLDNIGVEYAGVIFAIAESPLEPGLIWAGTNDGLVHLTRDGGKSWTNLTRNLPNLPPWGTVSNIEASRHDAGTAYLTVDFHQMNNRDPFVYKTIDYGRTWKLITNGIPKSPLSYAHCVREDPVRRGLLYLGTESGLYVSFNDGESWQPLQRNLPHAPVYWIVVQEHFNDLVVATYGRGFWILDDLGPLQQLTPEVAAADAH